MTQVSISEAARLAGVSRSTLNRHLKDGKISKRRNNSGQPYVDVAELQRFYGELSQAKRPVQDTVGQRGTAHNQAVMSGLQHKLEAVEAALEAEKQLRQKVEDSEAKWQAQAERLTLLLTDQRQPAPEPSRGVSFLGFQISRKVGRS